MSVRSQTNRKNYHSNRTPPTKPTTPTSDGVDDKRKAFLKAREEYEDAVRKAGKVPGGLKEDTKSLLKSALKGGVVIASGVINAGARVGDAVERDLRRNSIQGQIDRALVNAMYDKKKGKLTVTKRKSEKPKLYFKMKINGVETMVPEDDLPKIPRRRRY